MMTLVAVLIIRIIIGRRRRIEVEIIWVIWITGIWGWQRFLGTLGDGVLAEITRWPITVLGGCEFGGVGPSFHSFVGYSKGDHRRVVWDWKI